MNEKLITIYRETKATVNAAPMRLDTQMRGPQAAATFAVASELIAAGMDRGEAFKSAADLCWRIETGKPMPAWIDEMGNQTAASRAYDAGFAAHHHS